MHQHTVNAPVCAGVLCGAAASGQYEWTPESVAKSALCMLMSGPLLTGYTQTINDYYDRDIDAINEPNRPIPSGIWLTEAFATDASMSFFFEQAEDNQDLEACCPVCFVTIAAGEMDWHCKILSLGLCQMCSFALQVPFLRDKWSLKPGSCC